MYTKQRPLRTAALLLILTLIVSLLAFAPALVSAQAADDEVLNRTDVTLYVGSVGANTVASVNKAHLEALSGNPVISWTSSDPGVARVSASGVVTAKSAGTTVVTATTAAGTASCNVEVVALPALELPGIPAGFSATKPARNESISNTSDRHDAEVVYVPEEERYYNISTGTYLIKTSTDLITWTNGYTIPSAVTQPGRDHLSTNSFGRYSSNSWWAPCYFYNPVMERWCLYYSLSTAMNDGGRGFGNKTSAIGLAVLEPQESIPYSMGNQNNWVSKGIATKSYDALANYNTGNANLVAPMEGYLLTSTTTNGGWRLGPNNQLSAQHGPNAIDAQVLMDKDGERIYMVYGSFYEGIFMLELDPATGLPFATVDPEDPDKQLKTDPGICVARRGGTYVTAEPLDNRRTMNGTGTTAERYHVGIEGPNIFYNEDTGYYYLIVSYGYNNGSYNLRVGRSKNVTGPFYDYNGYNMVTYSQDNLNRPDPINPATIYNTSTLNSGSGWQGNAGTTPFDVFLKNETLSWDPNVGTKILSPYRFVNSTGTTTENNYTALGHHATMQSPTGDWMMGHIQKGSSTRFAVRNMIWTEDGWPMASPAKYAGENIHQPIDAVQLAADNTSTTTNFEVIVFERDMGPEGNSSFTALSVGVTLRADGTIYSSNNNYNGGKWRMYEDNKMEITIGSRIFTGKAAVGWDWDNWDGAEFVFAGMDDTGTMMWGKGGNPADNSVALTTDKTALIDAYNEVEPPENFLNDAWASFEPVLTYAQEVIDDVSAAQSEINDAEAALRAAWEALAEAKVMPLTLELAQPSQIRLRVGQTYTIALNTNLSLSEIQMVATPSGFLSIDPATGIIKCTKAGGTVILVIKSDTRPQLQPLIVVITTSA